MAPIESFVLDVDAIFEDLEYAPHEGQRLVHRSRAPRRIVACGVRWGKSRCAAMEAVLAVEDPRAASDDDLVGIEVAA